MSKIWPDPLKDKGDEFWDFDNMVNEYDWEKKRAVKRRTRKTYTDTFSKKRVAVIIGILAGMVVSCFIMPLIVIILFFVLLWAMFSDKL